jgi:hypothetical protein
MNIKLAKISSSADPNAPAYVAHSLDHVQKVCELIGTRDTVWSVKQLRVIGERAAKGELNYHDNGHTVTLDITEPSEIVSSAAPKTFVVCEIIRQEPRVSVHPTEAAALKHAVQCAMENLYDATTYFDTARVELESTLTDYGRIQEGDYEVHILTPTN